MTLLTSQEKMIMKFLTLSLAVGLIIGIVRNTYFSQDFSQQIEEETESFKSSTKNIVNSDSMINKKALTKTDDIEDEKSVKSLDINTANKTELLTLPKVGPVTAERIIRFRTDYGPFKSVDDLLKIKGIGSKTLDKIKPFITIGKNG